MNLAIHSETNTSVMWSWLERLGRVSPPKSQRNQVVIKLTWLSQGSVISIIFPHDYTRSYLSLHYGNQGDPWFLEWLIREFQEFHDSSRTPWIPGKLRKFQENYTILHHRLGYINPHLRGSNQSSQGLQSSETIQRPTAPSSRLNLNLLTQIHCCITVLICNKCY